MAPLHRPSDTSHLREDPESATNNARFGRRLFAVYLAVYALFVVVNTFLPEWTEWRPLLGINLAILSGVLLILLAIALAILYGWRCQSAVGTFSENHGRKASP
jgi:uncharacterized membrane protein (DUF485 family)